MFLLLLLCAYFLLIDATCVCNQNVMAEISFAVCMRRLLCGKVYSVVSRRHGKVLDAVGMDDSEKTFLVRAQIPVAESHGFANEIRKTTSGQANPNLRFSHYEIIDGDPYYNFEETPEDADDEEETNADACKRASQLRREIRKRKGLRVDDQVVVHAEKQRTLKK